MLLMWAGALTRLVSAFAARSSRGSAVAQAMADMEGHPAHIMPTE